MQYRLRTLLVVLAIAPPILAAFLYAFWAALPNLQILYIGTKCAAALAVANSTAILPGPFDLQYVLKQRST
jgi:hypothetical protein